MMVMLLLMVMMVMLLLMVMMVMLLLMVMMVMMTKTMMVRMMTTTTTTTTTMMMILLPLGNPSQNALLRRMAQHDQGDLVAIKCLIGFQECQRGVVWRGLV